MAKQVSGPFQLMIELSIVKLVHVHVHTLCVRRIGNSRLGYNSYVAKVVNCAGVNFIGNIYRQEVKTDRVVELLTWQAQS